MSTAKKKPNRRLVEAAKLVPFGWPPANLIAQKREFDRTVVFDLHGPIVDWSGRFCEYASIKLGRNIDASKMVHYCSGYDAGMPITPREFFELFWAFAALSNGGYDSLKAQPHAVESIHKIQKAGIKVQIWTYVPGPSDADSDTLISLDTGASQEGTMRLLEKIGVGTAREVRRMVRFVHPEHKAAQMGKESLPLIVEDHPATAVMHSMAYGGATILVPETYNSNITAPGIMRLDNRADLADAVIGFFDGLGQAGCLNIDPEADAS